LIFRGEYGISPYNTRTKPVNTVFGGICGGQNAPDSGVNVPSASSRSAFDVYVDGLPVFSDANYFDHNAAYEDAFGSLTTSFGLQAPLPNVLIYLGKIPPGGNFTVDVVMRAEATANAPTCGTQQFIGFSRPTIYRRTVLIWMRPSPFPRPVRVSP